MGVSFRIPIEHSCFFIYRYCKTTMKPTYWFRFIIYLYTYTSIIISLTSTCVIPQALLWKTINVVTNYFSVFLVMPDVHSFTCYNTISFFYMLQYHSVLRQSCFVRAYCSCGSLCLYCRVCQLLCKHWYQKHNHLWYLSNYCWNFRQWL